MISEEGEDEERRARSGSSDLANEIAVENATGSHQLDYTL